MMRTITGEKSDPYYDLFGDWDLIVSSLLSQYGIRIYSQTFKEMKWDEFSALLSGIGPDTPLGRVVAIRAETDKEIIKNFSSDQKRIWSEWRRKLAGQKSEADVMAALDAFKTAFINIAGGTVENKES